MNDLRPTLFLAQLSNLLAGNISIVHGVTGSSRTFMGEEYRRRRCRAHCACPHRRPARATSRWSAAPRTPNAKKCCCSMSSAASACRANSPRCGTATAVRASRSARWARSWCSKAATMRTRAAPGRLLGSPASSTPARERKPGAVTATLGRSQAAIGTSFAAALHGRYLGRDRSRGDDRRGARLFGGTPGPCRPRHRNPYRSRVGAAIRYEYRAGGARGAAGQAVCTAPIVSSAR